MKRILRSIGICLMTAVFFWCGTLIADRQRLCNELIRLHVVANSDSPEDQTLKMQVKDAITRSMKADLQKISDVDTAKAYLQKNLPYIRSIASQTLQSFGCDDTVEVSLCREEFGTRMYDTFTLPAGVYHALRIVIGEGQGKNWWCVVFPGLCIPAASEGFEAVAVDAGFPDALNESLTGKAGYEVRFAVLDAMGKLENILFSD